MVRVWYEPPPGGPRSHLNRGAYGVESSMEPLWVKKLARMRPVSVIVPAVSFFAFVCYLPLCKYFPQPDDTLQWDKLLNSLYFLFCYYLNSEPKELAFDFEP